GLARISTSAASRSALCSSFKPRCASTTARKASSGLAKFEAVESGMTNPLVQAGGAGQRRLERRTGRVSKARGDITIGAQQIAGSGLGIIAGACQPFAVDQSVLAADPDRGHAVGRINRGAIAKRQQGELRSLFDEGL